MPPIYYLNPPPNPFWDFVAGLDLDHPNFRAPPQQRHGHNGPPSPPPPPGQAPAAPPHTAPPNMSEKTQGKQATVEDPPEMDPASIIPESKKAEKQADQERAHPCRGRGRFANAFDGQDNGAGQQADEKAFPFRGRGRFAHTFDGEDNEPRRGRGDHPCRRGRGRAGWTGWAGPPPFMFGHPFFAPHRGPHAGPHAPDHEHRGPWGGPHHRHSPPPHARGPPEGHNRRSSPQHGPRHGFDLSDFLGKLGDRLGVDLSNAAEGLGLAADRFTAGKTTQDINFEPRADIFENKDLYTIHLSLPGAKKSDVGVDYDGEHSMLRITGVVHRPDVDEQMLSELVVDGRKRETGVFEKAIRLGTKRDPANIDVAGISAKMIDGVLIVRIPKVEKVHQKREVPITADPVAEEQADYEDEYSEKPVLFDAEDHASDAGTEHTEVPKKEPISLLDMRHDESHIEQTPAVEAPRSTPKYEGAKQGQAEGESALHKEPLPAYSDNTTHDEDDWEKFSDASGEGEYIKINVD